MGLLYAAHFRTTVHFGGRPTKNYNQGHAFGNNDNFQAVIVATVVVTDELMFMSVAEADPPQRRLKMDKPESHHGDRMEYMNVPCAIYCP